MPVAPRSYADYAHVDPSAFYENVRQLGRVVWDEGMQSWLITDFEDVSRVLRDESVFAAPFTKFGFADFFGPRGLLLLEGEPHRQLYVAVRRFFTPQAAQQYADQFLTPILEETLARILPTGEAELASDYAEQIPVRMIASILGLDWRDARLIRHCWEWIDAYQRHTLNYLLPGNEPEQTRAAAADGMRRVEEVLLPLVRAKKKQSEASYIREVDRVGHQIFDDWSDADTVDQCKFLLVAGMHTTSSLICNATHFLLTDTQLMATVTEDPDSRLGPLVEEALRLRPSIQLRPRIAAKNVELHGVKIRSGDRVITLLAAANRSPGTYDRPDQVELERDGLRSHLAFNAGPRFCGGAPLARIEATETLRAMLAEMRGLRLDMTQPEPVYTGFIQRTMRPLHVLFEPIKQSVGG